MYRILLLLIALYADWGFAQTGAEISSLYQDLAQLPFMKGRFAMEVGADGVAFYSSDDTQTPGSETSGLSIEINTFEAAPGDTLNGDEVEMTLHGVRKDLAALAAMQGTELSGVASSTSTVNGIEVHYLDHCMGDAYCGRIAVFMYGRRAVLCTMFAAERWEEGRDIVPRLVAAVIRSGKL